MKVILILILSLFLSGCGIFPRKDVPTITPKVVRIDSEALTPCSLLKEDLTVVTFEDALTVYGDLATQYGICATKQNNSIKLLKEFSGSK